MVTQGARSLGERLPRRVWVVTQDRVYVGMTHLYKGERLLDFLNGAAVSDKVFLPLDDLRVRTRSIASPEGLLPNAVVNVHQILLAWEADVPSQFRPDIVPKRSIPVRLELDGQLVLQGNVHCAPAESVLNMLNRRERYAPLTDVRLTLAAWEGQVSLPFAAVNKEYVVSACEVAVAVGTPPPAVSITELGF